MIRGIVRATVGLGAGATALLGNLLDFTGNASNAAKDYSDNWLYAPIDALGKFAHKNPALTVVSIVGIVALSQLDFASIWKSISDPVRSHRYGHLDQPTARSDWAFYSSSAIQAQLDLLQMSVDELAKRSDLSVSTVDFFLRRPEVYPRPEIMARFETGLMLPRSYFATNVQYGVGTSFQKPTRQRLHRYLDQRRASVYTNEIHEKLSPARAAEILKSIENQFKGILAQRVKL